MGESRHDRARRRRARDRARSATLEAVRISKSAGALISFDVNYRPALWRSADEALNQIASLVPEADLLKVNEIELELLTNTRDLEQGSAMLLERGPRLVVITLGAQGSYYCTTQKRGFAPPFKVTAIDSTGCGDSFTGALLTRLVKHNWDELDAALQDDLRFANAAGAITSTRRGAIPALPTGKEVQDFLAQY